MKSTRRELFTALGVIAAGVAVPVVGLATQQEAGVETRSGPRIIFTAPKGEKVVSMIASQGQIYAVTQRSVTQLWVSDLLNTEEDQR